MNVGNQFARFNEMRQNLEQGVESVFNSVDNRLVENDHRNNAQERMSDQITATFLGLSAKMEQSINIPNKSMKSIHKWRIEWKTNKNWSAEIKNSIDSTTRHCAKTIRQWCRRVLAYGCKTR